MEIQEPRRAVFYLSCACVGIVSMKIGAGFKARLEFVLEQVVKNLSYGGDHKTRAFIAARLLKAAQSGIVKSEDLVRVAQDALLDALRGGGFSLSGNWDSKNYPGGGDRQGRLGVCNAVGTARPDNVSAHKSFPMPGWV